MVKTGNRHPCQNNGGPTASLARRPVYDGRRFVGIFFSSRLEHVADALSAADHPVRTLEHGVTEIYLSPGTKEMLEGDLLTGGYVAEPCDRPYKDDLGLLVGDQRDLTDLLE
jgi:hypothetical protein